MLSDEVAISDLGRIVTGKTPSTKNPAFFDGDYQFVTPSDLDWKTYYCQSTERTVTEDARKAHSNQFIPSDAIMMTCIGNTIGKCGISSRDCLTNQQINSIIPATGINSRFIYYLMIQNRELIRGFGLGGGSATPILNKTTFSKIRLRVPLRSHWARIASTLSAYDDLIENNQRRIQLLEQSAQLLYKEWFVHLRFPGHEHITITDGVPEGWKKKNALDVMDVLSGGTPKTSVPDYWNGEIPFFTSKDTTDYAYIFSTERTLTEEGLRNCSSRLYPKDTVFITARGTVGKINLAQTDMAMNQSCYALVAKPPLNQQFLYFAMVENVEQFRSRAVGAIFDAIIRNTFKLIPFVVPETKLIARFTDTISPTLRQIDVLSTEIRKLTQARDLLLPRLMNGEISV